MSRRKAEHSVSAFSVPESTGRTVASLGSRTIAFEVEQMLSAATVAATEWSGLSNLK